MRHTRNRKYGWSIIKSISQKKRKKNYYRLFKSYTVLVHYVPKIWHFKPITRFWWNKEKTMTFMHIVKYQNLSFPLQVTEHKFDGQKYIFKKHYYHMVAKINKYLNALKQMHEYYSILLILHKAKYPKSSKDRKLDSKKKILHFEKDLLLSLFYLN